MVQMVTQAAQEGYAIIWITGRPASQEAVTLGNLTGVGLTPGGINAGYPGPDDAQHRVRTACSRSPRQPTTTRPIPTT